MISIERSETAQKSALEIRDKFSPRQNAVRDKIPSIFFPMVRNFFFFFFQTEFCLGLNLPQTEFVSDYIPQLYFVCNLLISLVNGKPQVVSLGPLNLFNSQVFPFEL